MQVPSLLHSARAWIPAPRDQRIRRPVFHGFGKGTHFLRFRAPMNWVIGQQARSGIGMQPRSRKSCAKLAYSKGKIRTRYAPQVIRCHDTCGTVFFGSIIFSENPKGGTPWPGRRLFWLKSASVSKSTVTCQPTATCRPNSNFPFRELLVCERSRVAGVPAFLDLKWATALGPSVVGGSVES